MQVEDWVGLRNGWKLHFEQPMLVDAVEGFDELNFSNEHLLVLPDVVPVKAGITDEWLLDYQRRAATMAVEKGLADQDLGLIDGVGWSGSLAYSRLPDGQEAKLVGYLAAPQAVLHLTVRFQDPDKIGMARRLIGAVKHDAVQAAEVDQALDIAKDVFDRDPPHGGNPG